VTFPPAVAAGKIDGMLKVYLFFGEQDFVDSEHRVKHHHRHEPGQKLLHGDVVKDDCIQIHGISPYQPNIDIKTINLARPEGGSRIV
jgi:hypothetical protein